ncbi:transposase [Alicyclobacillus dauci]|uniref:Transposase n=2 Tax=Alicyclobacillus dauci TaxID=1475485 RepID=A0ABY6Z5W1_9BACL|nr:transposase [Alicyclobacillus dauci]WAH38288.1 transposase [Alicyclobacillus dauci]
MPRKLLTDAQLGILQVMSSRQQGGIDPNSGLPMGFYTSMIDLFNPSQPAKSPSFHPLLAFESQMGCCIYDELRSGDAHTAEGFAAFYEAMKKQLPTGVNIRAIRMDKGFTGEKVFQTLEQDGRDYVIKLKWTKRLAELAPNLAWHCITQSDTEHCDVASLMYQATSWEKPRRVVIVRRLDIDPQEVLCADWFWEYEAIATTFDWNGEDIWHFYNHRGNAENHIKEAKYGFAVDQFSSQNFNTNKALEALKLLAYNLRSCYINKQRCNLECVSGQLDGSGGDYSFYPEFWFTMHVSGQFVCPSSHSACPPKSFRWRHSDFQAELAKMTVHYGRGKVCPKVQSRTTMLS